MFKSEGKQVKNVCKNEILARNEMSLDIKQKTPNVEYNCKKCGDT